MIDLCFLREVRWCWQGASMLGMNGRMKVWKRRWIWCCGGMVKEELCEKVVEVRMANDRVVTLVVFEEDVLRLICGYAPQNRRSLGE